MKKYFYTTLIVLTLMLSCQKDDFCVDPITPNVVIRFYDNANPDNYKKVSGLTVWAEGLGELYTNVSVDSIAIPLDPAEDFTIYNLKSSTGEDQITINYLRKEVFVSRSCGYKYNFNEVNLTNVTNTWIIGTEITKETVENETEHIKILH